MNKTTIPKLSPKDLFISFVTWFAVFYLAMTAYNYFFPKEGTSKYPEGGVEISDNSGGSFVSGTPIELQIANHQKADFVKFKSPCEGTKDHLVIKDIEKEQYINCDQKDLIPSFELKMGESTSIDLRPFQSDIFTQPREYNLQFLFTTEDDRIINKTHLITIEEPGFIRRAFRFIITTPMLNGLVWIENNLPGHSIGWAVVILTIIIRLLLFLPNQKAIRSQQKLQKLQPKIQEIQKKNKGNQQMQAMAMMNLYKEEKISPMSSCLPLLLQMPILIGLYFVVSGGLSNHLKPFLYKWGFPEGVDFSKFDPHFFGYDLSMAPSAHSSIALSLILPLMVGVTQFVAMKLMSPAQDKNEKKEPNKNPSFGEQMKEAQKIMVWVLPVMIAFFTWGFPAAVGIYWVTSTVFGIGQQQLIKLQKEKKEPRVVTGVITKKETTSATPKKISSKRKK